MFSCWLSEAESHLVNLLFLLLSFIPLTQHCNPPLTKYKSLPSLPCLFVTSLASSTLPPSFAPWQTIHLSGWNNVTHMFSSLLSDSVFIPCHPPNPFQSPLHPPTSSKHTTWDLTRSPPHHRCPAVRTVGEPAQELLMPAPQTHVRYQPATTKTKQNKTKQVSRYHMHH